MLLHSIVFILGLGILYLGADWLVQGASEVAKRFGIRPMIIGLTIVALGTSIPEFLLNFFAVMIGEDGLAIGNIIGSNISNIALILGVSAAIMPIAFDDNALKKEYPMMLAVTGLFYLLAMDGRISRFDGVILLIGLGMFMAYIIWDAIDHSKKRKVSRAPEPNPATEPISSAEPASSTEPASAIEPDGSETESQTKFRAFVQSHRDASYFRIVLIVGGISALSVGARLMVDSAIGIATILEIAPIVIGLTIVAIGTSLPELAASLIAAVKKEGDMSVGNILGSNMLNILFVIGFVAVIRPMEIESETIRYHFPVLIVFSLILYPLARKKQALSRTDGIILLVLFCTYLAWLIYPEL
jgi:cation:H+ antiporter